MRNPHLEVDRDNLAMWNRPENRRWGFRNIHMLNRSGLVLRSSRVLPLRTRNEPRIGTMPEVRRLTGLPTFCAMVVVRERDILFETYAADCSPETVHSMQSITKTHLNLIFGRLVADGVIDPEGKVEDWIPEIGSGYRGVTVQQVLDMNVMLAFDEDYSAPWNPPPRPGERRGYGEEEVAMGWRLAPPETANYGVREFALRLENDSSENPGNFTRYASPNTDLAGWIAERASGTDLKHHVAANIEGAGIEGTFFVSLDREFVPVLSGGGAMTARDMARYGLLFARRGEGLGAERVGDPAFIERTRSNRGTHFGEPWQGLRYSNQMFTDGTWIGHGGYAGQYLMAHPEKEAAIAWFSVLETPLGDDQNHLANVIAMAAEILESL